MRWWIEWPQGGRSLVLFFLAIVAAVVTLIFLPAETWEIRWHVLRRTRIPAPGVSAVLWSVGWFALTFVRAEDSNVLAPVDCQSLVRYSAIALIVAGAVTTAILALP